MAVGIQNALLNGDLAGLTNVERILYHNTSCQQMHALPYSHEVVPASKGNQSVSIIVPTRNQRDLLEACIDSIRSRTRYDIDAIEIIVIDNGSDELAAVNYLGELTQARGFKVLRDNSPFNFARLNNHAVSIAKGDFLVFLNNDTEVLDEEWLLKLIDVASGSRVAAVGCKLLYPDGTIQHGGTILGIQGIAAHAFVGKVGPANRFDLTREVSAVTGACLAMRRSIFLELGGFDEVLSVAFNDTLLCVSALSRGYTNICISDPLMRHHESKNAWLR